MSQKSRILGVFFLSFSHLIVTQVFYRKLVLVFPLAASGYAALLVAQFMPAVIGFAIARMLSISLILRRVMPAALITAIVILLAVSTLFGAVLFVVVAYYFAQALLMACAVLLFRQSDRAYTYAKYTFMMHSGSAIGLLILEKSLVMFLPLDTLLIIASCGIGIGGLFLLLPAASETFPEHIETDTDFRGLAVAFLVGIILFGGLTLVQRLFSLYIRESAQIIAEVTALSMIVSAIVNFVLAKRHKLIKTQYGAIAAAAIFAYFTLIVQFLGEFRNLAREMFILLGVAPLAAIGAYLYNCALVKNIPATVLSLNTLGAACGAGMFGIILLPKLGAEIALLCLGFLTTIALGLIAWPYRTKQRYLVIWVLAPMLLTVRFGWFSEQLHKYVANEYPGENLLGQSEGGQATWILTSATGLNGPYFRLVTNGHSMAGTSWPNRRYMKLMAYLGRFYTPNAQRALNIGYGTGLTASAILEDNNLFALDIVDVSKDMLRLTKRIFEAENYPNPMNDVRLAFSVGGARHVLSRSTETYDIITGEPPPPGNTQIDFLYTQEFFGLVRDRLSTRGTFTYWLPLHAVRPKSALAIWKTFCSVFEDCHLFAGTETNLIMVGGRKVANGKSVFDPARQLPWEKVATETGVSSVHELFSLLLASGFSQSKDISVLTDNQSYIADSVPQFWEQHTEFLAITRADQARAVRVAMAERFRPQDADILRIVPTFINLVDISAYPQQSALWIRAYIRECKIQGIKPNLNLLKRLPAWRNLSKHVDKWVPPEMTPRGYKNLFYF